jgi:hypothetical protein
MENEEKAPSMYQHAAKFGMFLALISIALTVVVYSLDMSILATFKFLGLVLVVTLGFIIYAGINYRNTGDGFISYGNAFLYGIVLCAVAGLISTGFNILLYHVIDPELPVKLADAILLNTEDMMRSFGAAEAAIDETIDKMRDQQMEKQFSVGNLAIGYLKAFIGYAIINAITALIIRKNQPVEL